MEGVINAPKRFAPAFAPIDAEPQPAFEQSETYGQAQFAAAKDTPSRGKDRPAGTPGAADPEGPRSENKWHPRTWWHKFKRLSRGKKIIFVSALTGLLCFAGGLLWYFVIRAEPAPPLPPPPPPVVKEEPKPTTVASPLTGIQIQPELAELPVTGVMIENSPDARPQSGLYEAGVVFEAIAEGGITRFLALFQESQPKHIGPVRSVRPYYLDFLAPFDAPIAHAGGSGQALAELRSQGFKDLEAFQNPNYYERVSYRYSPHNLYTSRSNLLKLQKSKGWTSSKFTGFVRKEEEKAAAPTASKIDLSVSSYLYNVHYDYEGKTNSYKRVMGRVAHTDEKSKNQISPKVVVALVMSHGYAGVYSVYGVTGQGAAYVFQDGTVTKGTWHKKNRKTQLTFKDANGAELKLNPGQTWLTLVSSPGAVTYK